jgi:recombination protein RecA
MSSPLLALRAQLDRLAPRPAPAGPAWSTGLPELDAALGGGVPRAGITELVGPRSAGRTTLARRLVAEVLAAGRWVAVIDAERTLAPQDWADLGARLVVIRPHDAERAAWCADRLLRSGVFALVVLDGVRPLPRASSVRLAQLARERETALLVVGAVSAAAPVISGGPTLRLRVQARPTAEVRVDKGAPPARVPVPWRVAIRPRLAITPPAADRRGAARERRPHGTPSRGRR